MKTLHVMLLTGMLLSGLPNQAALAEQVQLDVSPVKSVLKAGEKETTWIRVESGWLSDGLRRTRPGTNLVLVLDKSGSMQGDKIRRAREAAIDAIHLLSPQDIVSIVTYDTTVNVVVPATKLTDKESVIAAIRGIEAGGNTALFAGVSKGAAEVRKFLDREKVNRVILLSDGLANVGPSSPGELGSLGESLLKENIAVTTLGLGLGYNEDLMAQLATKSGGNHYFVEEASELADIFRREFDDVLSVVAQEVEILVDIPENIRPVRVLGNDADINGQQVVSRLSSIYSEQNKHIVIEVEFPNSDPNTELVLGNVRVTYTNMKTAATDQLSGTVKVRFSDSDEEVAASLNASVLGDVVALVSNEQNKLATKYLDEGDLIKCREILRHNGLYLESNSALVPDGDRLRRLSRFNYEQAEELEGVTSRNDTRAVKARKAGLSVQSAVESQRAIDPTK